ncbi:ribonuclease T2 [Paracoccus sp. 1_MG-2023]|uniref:ribonuclease T2 family protein n=1 Tax=unclassified Paracoccus (in: a-proteobacteria) TaxID=2688777 RepID=UPI001C08E3D1|nr:MULTISPECIES: ribonuclease T2 [unclassified Paracoccus (in: a-proteobacteria)]MBU2956927.1 ribonuclease T2 [Paracoccus sp. C2R09]MDO6668125.1 ribonuclease T2 [Paracoccus sp. 1_MG-2023]
MRKIVTLLAAMAAPLPVAADTAGDFDYYVLALSWQPSWCSATGDDRDAPECDGGTGRDFSVHGLWPQYEDGWPQDCATPERDPSRRESQAMSDVMGSGGLAWYQWKKHGRCSGLSSQAYYDATRKAYESLEIPEVFDDLGRDITLPPSVVEEAFLEVNPNLSPDGLTVSCRDGVLTELKICLTRDLEFRDCAPDTRRDCSSASVLMEAVR